MNLIQVVLSRLLFLTCDHQLNLVPHTWRLSLVLEQNSTREISLVLALKKLDRQNSTPVKQNLALIFINFKAQEIGM